MRSHRFFLTSTKMNLVMAKSSLITQHYILLCLQVVVYIYLTYISEPMQRIQIFFPLLFQVSNFFIIFVEYDIIILSLYFKSIAPVLSLSVSQFSELFFPEILGFTLQIEWTVLDLVSTSKLLKFYGLDAHFYDMHIAIDNASSGHGMVCNNK
jgi:hypothetical protein